MAKKWVDGFEFRLLNCVGSILGANTFDTPGRNSVGTYFQNGTTSMISGTNVFGFIYTLPTSYPSDCRLNEGYLRIAFYISGAYNATDANNTWIRFKDSSGNDFVEIVANSSGVLELYAGVSGDKTLLGSGITLETWHVLQIYFKIDPSAGEVIVKLDGSQVGSNVTGNTGASSGTFNTIQFNTRHLQSVTLGIIRLDDITLHDTTGVNNASYPPDADILRVTLGSSGDLSDFLGSDGNSTNNYQLVDEVPFSASDYVESDTLDATDLYNSNNITLASGRVISGAIIKGQVRKTSATVTTGISPVTKQGGTVYEQTELILPNTTSQVLLGDVMELDPTGAAWTETNFNSLQIGARKTT